LRRNCILKHVNEGKIERRIEVRGRRERRCKQLVHHRKKRRGYCRLKEEAVYGFLRITRFGRGCGALVRETAVNAYMCPKGPHTS